MKRWFLVAMLALLAVGPEATIASAAQLTGEVTAVDGREVRIALDGDLVPQPGDEVTIEFQIPGGPRVRVGTWKVARADGAAVVATQVEATGAPAVGQLATIASAHPVARAAAPAPPQRPATPGELGAWLGNAAGLARVEKLGPGGPAERAGLRVGDVIVGADGTRTHPDALAALVRNRGAGAPLRLRVNRIGQEIDVPVTLGGREAFVEPPAPEPYNSGVGWSVIGAGPARVEYRGRVYETLYNRMVKSGVAYPIEMYFFDTPPKGKVQAVVNGQKLENRFLREPAADYADQSKAGWRLYSYEYRKGQWAFRDEPNLDVRVLSQPGR